MPDGIDTSIYRNQPNPLGQLSNVYNIENAAQELRLRQQSEQIRNFELQDKQNQAINGVLGPLQTVPGLDLKGAQSIVLPQLRALGLDPYKHPRTAPLFTGELNTPEKFDAYMKGNAAPFLGAGAFQPVTGPATAAGAQTTVLPSERAAIKGPAAIGLTPEAQAAASTIGTMGGASYGNARDLSMNLPIQTYGLKQAIHAISQLKASDVGPIGEYLNGIKSFAISAGLDKLFGIDVSKVTDYQTARKYLNDWARNSGAGPNSVAQLEAAQSSNPNMSLEQNALLKTSRSALALARMKAMQQKDFEAARVADPSIRKEDFPGWVAQHWATRHDPTVYLMDQLPVADRKKYIDSLSTKKQKGAIFSPHDQFMYDYGLAEQAGIID